MADSYSRTQPPDHWRGSSAAPEENVGDAADTVEVADAKQDPRGQNGASSDALRSPTTEHQDPETYSSRTLMADLSVPLMLLLNMQALIIPTWERPTPFVIAPRCHKSHVLATGLHDGTTVLAIMTYPLLSTAMVANAVAMAALVFRAVECAVGRSTRVQLAATGMQAVLLLVVTATEALLKVLGDADDAENGEPPCPVPHTQDVRWHSIVHLLICTLVAAAAFTTKLTNVRLRTHRATANVPRMGELSAVQRQLLLLTVAVTTYTVLGGVLFGWLDRRTVEEGLFLALMTITTIGMVQGPRTTAAQLVLVLYGSIGITLFGLTIYAVRQALLEALTHRLVRTVQDLVVRRRTPSDTFRAISDNAPPRSASVAGASFDRLIPGTGNDPTEPLLSRSAPHSLGASSPTESLESPTDHSLSQRAAPWPIERLRTRSDLAIQRHRWSPYSAPTTKSPTAHFQAGGSLDVQIWRPSFSRAIVQLQNASEAADSSSAGGPAVTGWGCTSALEQLRAATRLDAPPSPAAAQDAPEIDEQLLVKYSRQQMLWQLLVALCTAALFLVGFGAAFSILEGWTLHAAVYFCYTVMAAIGFGDMQLRTIEGRALLIWMVFFGVGVMTWLVSVLGDTVTGWWLDRVVRGIELRVEARQQQRARYVQLLGSVG